MRRVGVMLVLLLAIPAIASSRGAHAGLQGHAHGQPATYACPMHPEVTAPAPGACSLCAMPLTPLHADANGRRYRLRVETEPEQIEPGRPFRLRLTVRREGDDDVVKDFTVVHEKPFHLFVISRDLEHYAHLHPVPDGNGTWVEQLTLPRPGMYKVFADVLPAGDSPQVLVQPLDVNARSGSNGDRAAALEPDGVLERTVGDLAVRLSLPAGGLVAGRHQALTFRFTDARSGAALRDLQPYLGAWGHTVMLSEDVEHFVHAHPVEPLDARFGGPELTFHAAPPSAGTYRVWTQIMRNGSVETIVFTLPVRSAR